jgi:hypothetical protein
LGGVVQDLFKRCLVHTQHYNAHWSY